MKKILITTASNDGPNIETVVKHLKTMGYKVLIYEADKVFSQNKSLRISIDSESPLSSSYDDQVISKRSIAAAWSRRPNLFRLGFKDKARELLMEKELKQLQDGIWSLIPDSKWLNAPKQLQIANHKLFQLDIARNIGFNVPRTVVSNDWELITSTLKLPLIMKMSRGMLYIENVPKVVYTTMLDNKKLQLLASTSPYPGIFQEYIPKAREWRVTVVGKTVFAVAIYTNDDAKDDWRKHQHRDGMVRFQSERFPQDLQNKCIQFLEAINLKFGAFDFIERPDGTIYFLEINPSGQFVWLEDALGLPISKAIADELNSIAMQNQ